MLGAFFVMKHFNTIRILFSVRKAFPHLLLAPSRRAQTQRQPPRAHDDDGLTLLLLSFLDSYCFFIIIMVQKEKRRFSLSGAFSETSKKCQGCDISLQRRADCLSVAFFLVSSGSNTQSTGNTTQWDMTAIQQKRSSDNNNDKPRRDLSSDDGESPRKPRMRSAMKAQAVASSAGTSRLNRILHQPSEYRVSYVPSKDNQDDEYQPNRFIQKETLKDVKNPNQVGRYVAKVVTPPIAVDSRSIGGTLAEMKKVELVQECLLCMPCKNFEMTGERISMAALEDPSGYGKHKRSLGYGATPGKGRDKLRYICLVRATNRPLLKEKSKKSSNAAAEQATHETASQEDEQERRSGCLRCHVW